MSYRSIDVLTKDAAAAATTPLVQNLASKLSFFNAGCQHLGTLFAGSRFKRCMRDNHCLD